MGQMGPDITYDELKKQNIESLRIMSDLNDRLEKAQGENVTLREENERLVDDNDDLNGGILDRMFARGVTHRDQVIALIEIVKHCSEEEDEHGMCCCAHAIGEALAAKDVQREAVEAKLVEVRKARKILYDWTQTDIVDAVEEVCEVVRILDSALAAEKGE